MPGSSSNAGIADGIADHQIYNEVELPSFIEIRESSVSAGQPGAFSKSLIRNNTRFGPYKGEIIKPGEKVDIDYRYAWEVFEKKQSVLKFTISASDPKASNWMRNVNCARFYEEQNILSTQEGFSIFYVAMKDIKAGEELLTWFDPQLLKRTQRRMSRGERRKVGYTIELVPWTDEKKFVPEIIETKRSRKKKVLGEDMLCFQEDAALMQRSMNSMFRFSQKADSYVPPKKECAQSSRATTGQQMWSPKKNIIKTLPSTPTPEKKDHGKSPDTAPMTSPQKSSPEKLIAAVGIPQQGPNENNSVGVASNGITTVLKSPQSFVKKEVETVRKRRRRLGRVQGNPDYFMKKFTERLNIDSRKVSDSAVIYNPDSANLVKPIIIRTIEDGNVEMEDHDETYRISWSPVRQECDDMCPCMEKQGLLEQDVATSSSLHRGNQDLVVRFTLLPEHQTVADNNKIVYKCDICECSYNHAFSLKRHYLGIHINHRYISREDAEFCQLETFQNACIDEVANEAEQFGNDLNSEETVNAPEKDPELNTTCNENVHNDCPASSFNLLCNEATLDSSADEGRVEVPTLSALAKLQCEKNKSSFFSVAVSENNHLSEKKLLQNNDSSSQFNNNDSVLSSIDGMNGGIEEEKVEQHVCNDKTLLKMNAFETESTYEEAGAMESSKKKMDCETKVTDCIEGQSEEENKQAKLNNVPDSSNGIESGKKFDDNEVNDEEERGKNAGEFKENVRVELNSVDKERKEEMISREKRPVTNSQKDSDNSGEVNKSSLSEDSNPDVEKGQIGGAEKESAKDLTSPACETEATSNAGKLSSPQPALPIQTTNSIPTGNAKTLPTPQQFLLLVPIGSASGQIPPPITKSIPSISTLSLPPCQGKLPLVVFSSPVTSTSATGTHNRSVPTNLQVCPQFGLTSVSPPSSNLGQRVAFIPHNSQCLTTSSIHSTTSINNMTTSQQATGTGVSHTSAVTTTSCYKKPQHSSNIPSMPTPGTEALKQAVKLEEGDQPSDLYRCHMCVLVYKTMGELKHHIKNDPHRFKGGLKQYACPKCSVRFRNKANLARHTLMHHQTTDDKDRKFRCLTCGKGFTTETYLKMHARFHSGKSFPCKYGCVDAFFPNAGSLVKHLRAVHPGLNLKEYLREKKRSDRLKQRSDLMKMPKGMTSPSTSSSATAGYSMTNPGVGFQAKRGRPKGSKNAPKELKEIKPNINTGTNTFDKQLVPPRVNESGTENVPRVELYPPVKKYYPIEKTWQKGSSFFKISSDESAQSKRRFKCKLCAAAFKSHLFLLKHRSKRHRAGQAVQEYLFEMAKDKEEENCLAAEDTFQFSPPPSPKTFFANVNQRGAENMSKFIEGSGDMLKYRKKLSFDEDTMYPFSSPSQLEWTVYNFPPCFKYVKDNTTFYPSVARVGKPKVEKCEVTQDENVNADHTMKDVEREEKEKDEEMTSGLQFKNVEKSGACKIAESAGNMQDKDTPAVLDEQSASRSVVEETAKSNIDSDQCTSHESDKQIESPAPTTSLDANTKRNVTHGVKDSGMNDSTVSSSVGSKHDSVLSDLSKGFKKSPRKSRAGMDEMMARLNRLPMKALDLDIGSRHLNRHASSNSVSFLDSLNLFSKDGNETLSQKYLKRKKRERFASVSACSQLLPSKLFCRSRDQLTCSIFISPDAKDNRRFSMWQGPNCNKVDTTEHSDKFCCPVVESVRQQEESKKRKEIQERNDQEVIDIKPKEKAKEDFAESMGLISRREYDRSYHAQRQTEQCIKPPEIWERYDRIWFGKKGTITVVCSICHRHFSCQELCLRHQLKKHPHIEPGSLEMERGNYVEDMYYYYPMPYGILAQTHLIPENLPPPELFVCTRCRFPFKNLNKLYSHIISCDPNNCEQTTKSQTVPVERNVMAAPPPVTNRVVTSSNTNSMPTLPCVSKSHRQIQPNSKYRSYEMFYNTGKPVSTDNVSTTTTTTTTTTSSSVNKVLSKSPASSTSSTTSKSYVHFSSFPRRQKNQQGLLYNPSNHTRRREMVHVLDQHQCHGCNLKFNSMSMLERHVKKCSGKDKLQNQKPLLSGVADEMMLRKQHTCRYCNKRFTFIKGVDLHYKRICAIRKVREEENQLTEEDLAHEAELQRIIEHVKWSKSLNQDSSDIIQGRVKVEEDGTLTRVEKKRGRPFGTGKGIKKKGFKWTTLKYHKADDETSVTNNERVSSVEESVSNESLEPTQVGGLSKTSTHEIKQEERPTGNLTNRPVVDMPKRKRGRPLKNGGRSQSVNLDLPKRKRGRPPKRYLDYDVPVRKTSPVEMSLKESIDFKRSELRKEKLNANREKLVSSRPESGYSTNKPIYSWKSYSGTNQNDLRRKAASSVTTNKPLKTGKSTAPDESRKRKMVDETAVVETNVKPPARARGRPKKFDPSDMESSYKKKRKTDPGYVPFVKRSSGESLSNDSHTDGEDSKSSPQSDVTDTKGFESSGKSVDATKKDTENSRGNLKTSELRKDMSGQNVKSSFSKESFASSAKKDDSKQSVSSSQAVVKSTGSVTNKETNEERSGIVHSTSKLSAKTPDNSISVVKKSKSCGDAKPTDGRKRKHETSNEDSVVKIVKPDKTDSHETEQDIETTEDANLAKTASSQHSSSFSSTSDGCTESTTRTVTAANERHVTVTMASASASGGMVQTPVAVRIVTLPISSLATTTTLPSKVITSTQSQSSTSTPVQPLSPTLTSPVASSPVMKLTISPTSHLQLANKTLLSPGAIITTITPPSTTTTTSTATLTPKSPTHPIQNVPKYAAGGVPILKQLPASLPVRQIIPISNRGVLVQPKALHSGVAPRFVIRSSPRMAVPRQQRLPVPVPQVVASSLTRHVSPSTVILSTGKVVSLGSPAMTNLVRNPTGQQQQQHQHDGASLVKKFSVINPVANTVISSMPTQQFLQSPPPTVVQKGMGMVVDPAKSTAPLGSPPVNMNSNPLYYVQTSSLSNQVVLPISTIKSGVGASTSTNQVFFDPKDSKTIAVPGIQFIPVSLVQGVGQTLNPAHIITPPASNLAGDNSNVLNNQGGENS